MSLSKGLAECIRRLRYGARIVEVAGRKGCLLGLVGWGGGIEKTGGRWLAQTKGEREKETDGQTETNIRKESSRKIDRQKGKMTDRHT